MSFDKSILIVVESIDVNDSSASKGRVALIKNLHKTGFKLKVLHYTRKNIELDEISCTAIREQKWTFFYILSKLQLIIWRLTKWNLNLFIEKTIGFSFAYLNDSYSIEKAIQKENPQDYDLIFTLSKAASFRTHKALLNLKKWHNKWMAYIHDPYPMHSYPRPYDWVEPGHQFKRNFFLQVAEKCRYAVYPSQLLAKWMEGYYRPLEGKAIIIPHQLTNDVVKSRQNPSFFDSNQFNILHAGSLLWGRDPEGLILGFEMFLDKNQEAKKESRLLFLGSKNHYSDLLKDYSYKLLQIYVSEDYIPFEEVYKLQFASSVNVILEAQGPISPFLPGKFPHCIAADKPILLLGPHYSESRRLLKEDYPYWSENDDIKKIAGNIESLYKNWKEDKHQNLNRIDLVNYLSEIELKKSINSIIES
jgi:hypothetical protein